jgi:fibronectin type 3 domain-containing protein
MIMIKKLLMVFVLLMSFSASAFADTMVQPPTSVGTYSDFGKSIRLQWKPVTGAVSYNVYIAQGYNVQSGFVLNHKLTNYSLTYINRQYWIRDYVSVKKLGWYTVRVTSVDKDGNESAPCTTIVNVIR